MAYYRVHAKQIKKMRNRGNESKFEVAAVIHLQMDCRVEQGLRMEDWTIGAGPRGKAIMWNEKFGFS